MKNSIRSFFEKLDIINETMKHQKKHYKVWLKYALRQNKDFFVEQLSNEWHILEQENKRDERRKELLRLVKASGAEVGKMLLVLLLLSGVVVVAAVAPNVFSAFGRVSKKRRFFDKSTLQKSIHYLTQKKYITVQREKDCSLVQITDRGMDKVLIQMYHDYKIQPQEKWDGLWHIVIFDIPEKHRGARDSLRRKLCDMGFYQLQKSAFFYPYDCKEEIWFLASIHNVVDHIRYITAVEITHDDDLRKHFSL